jgi:hypothetical protein
MRAFSAYHSATLNASNHIDFVEAYLLQLGAGEQHEPTLSLLAACTRSFLHSKITYGGAGK